MFQLETKAQVIIFAVSVTIVAALLEIGRSYLLMPQSFFQDYALLNFGMTILGLFPVCLFAGFHLRKSHHNQLHLDRLIAYDTLTRALSRRRFIEMQSNYIDDCGILLIVDVDHFKNVNDTYGHLVGDQVLSEVSAALMDNCRDGDLVCRYGGEEFLVYFPDATPEAGAALCERLRVAVAANVHLGGRSGQSVTVSGGWVVKPKGSKTTDLLNAADEALLRAKSEGRNRFYAADSNLCISRQLTIPDDIPHLTVVG